MNLTTAIRAAAIVFILVVNAGTASSARAALVVGYDTDVGSTTPSVLSPGGNVGSNVTGLDLTVGGGIIADALGGDFTARNWSSTGFVEFGFTSTVGWDLENLQFELALGNDQEPTQFRLQAATNGGAFQNVGNIFDVDVSGFNAQFDLSSLVDINSANFRILAVNGVAAPNSSLVTFVNSDVAAFAPDITVSGTSRAVPEPTAAWLLLTLSLATLGRRRSA